MPCAECSLHDAIPKDHFAGIERSAVLATATGKSLAKCIQHIHRDSFGIAPCDLKPRNLVRIKGPLKLSLSLRDRRPAGPARAPPARLPTGRPRARPTGTGRLLTRTRKAGPGRPTPGRWQRAAPDTP
jgi:hypothetical protein